MIKKNIKVILAFLLGMIITIPSVYAVTKYLASDVTYKDTTVENALNDLYNINSTSKDKMTFGTNDFISTTSSGVFYTQTLDVPEGTKKVFIYDMISSTYGVLNQPTIKGDIIVKQFSNVGKESCVDSYVCNYYYYHEIDLNGKSGKINIDYSAAGGGKHSARGIMFYK